MTEFIGFGETRDIAAAVEVQTWLMFRSIYSTQQAIKA